MNAGVMKKHKKPHKIRPHMKCNDCYAVVSNVIQHLANYHFFNGHALFDMEESELKKYDAIIEKHFSPTEEELTSKIHKVGIK